MSVIGPAAEIDAYKAECQAMQFTVGEETQTTVWNGQTDQGADQTFDLIPDYSPEPHPEAYLLPSSVQSKTSGTAQAGKYVLGLYQQTFKQVGNCQVTDTTSYPPVVVTWDLPFFMYLGNITMYGASSSEGGL